MTRLDRTPNEQPAVEEWRTYGSVIDSLVWVPNGVTALLDALASGGIKARLVDPPNSAPPAEHPIPDAADPSSKDFWRAFKNAQLGHPAVDLKWTSWLRSQVEVQGEPVSAIYGNAIQRTTWNDLQTLAWFATQDGWLVAKMTNAANDDNRRELLRYLGSHVATRYCRCGAARPCECLESACEKLVGSLQTEDLHAVLLLNGRSARPISPAKIRAAPLDLAAVTFQLIEDPGELRFEECEVRSACERLSVAPSAEATKRARGALTRSPAGKREPPPSIDEILAKADEMKGRGMTGYDIAQNMHREAGFGGVKTTLVRDLIKGRYKRGR